ncbi:MAG: semialdehyde dehydrogenase, partial [Cyclobacteriaceae bacterium]|nr:semialdehyde dehydrogenase [Cyclobacteriaceae bacterium HetDA_MAG_MS6]
DSSYDVSYLEINPDAISRLAEKGVQVSKPEEVLPKADIVILSVPDVAIKLVSHDVVPLAKAGAIIVTLDPAAPLAGHVMMREDLSYYVTHPSHPSVFSWEPTEEAFKDYYGGIVAKQTVVSALMKGSEEDYQTGDALTHVIFAPVTVNHRITVEQMGILEPAFSETLSSTCINKIREGLDEVAKKGVPYEAARDFILGHINIQLAVLFGELPIKFSDAAIKALERADGILFKEDWKQIFEPEDVMEQIKAIT